MQELSGDNFLSFSQRIWYLVFNTVRGLWGYRKHLPLHFWAPKTTEEGPESPSRKQTDAFLRHWFSQTFPAARSLQVLDIGCGTGYVRKILAELGHEVIYTGLDIKKHPSFDKFSSYAIQNTFTQSSVEEVSFNQEFDLVLSMEALEHIQDDRRAVEVGIAALKPNGVQLHTVPSFWSLPLYLWHGWRQYTPARLSELFPRESTDWYKLGGVFSFLTHFLFITLWLPFSFKDVARNSRFYTKVCNVMVQADRMLPFGSVIYVAVSKKTS